MPKLKRFLRSAMPVVLTLLVQSVVYSMADDQCYIDVPDDRQSCTFSCIRTITEEYFQSLPGIMTNCKTVSYYLSNGNYTGFAPRYFSKVGHVQHFFIELQNVIFDHFPGKPGEESPFTNLTFDTSAILYLIRSGVTESWNWGAFSALRGIRGGTGSFEVYSANMTRLKRDFREVLGGDVRAVRFSSGNLQILDDEVFSNFPRLQQVYLHENELTEMKRNYFPNPANILEELVLQSNKLTSLPIDMFLNMPSIKYVSLGNNLFTTIDEAVFRPIAGRIRLGISSTTLECDCRLRWLKYVTGPYAENIQDGEICLTPPQLKGISLRNVTEEQLGCNENEIDN